MPSRATKAITFAMVALLAFLFLMQPIHAQAGPGTLAEVETAFARVQAAESAGANVSGLDASLNQAVQLLGMGNAIQQSNPAQAQLLFSKANIIASQVAASAQAEISAGEASTIQGEETLYETLGVIAVVCVLVYLALPKVFWRVWLRMNSNYRIEQND
jgi:hypothetical protein